MHRFSQGCTVLLEHVVPLQIHDRETGHHVPPKQCLITVGGDLFAVGNENDRTLFAIAADDPEDHNLRRSLREGADPDVFINFGHWQAC